MNHEAVARVLLAHADGWSYDDLADLYQRLKVQIEANNPSWTAARARCADGSHVFTGSLGRSLLFCPDRTVWVGDLGKAPQVTLISYQGMTVAPGGTLVFPVPNLAAPNTKQLA